jgi:hypothetical protein
MQNLIRPCFLLLMMFLMVIAADAQELPTISVQGTLKDANGASVSDGSYTVVFRLFNQEVGGEPVWQEEATVEVVDGIYSHYLGSITPLVSNNFGNMLYLGLKVGSYELSTRKRLTYAPYTFAAVKVTCSGAMGDIKYSSLNPVEFARENGDCWVPMDGRSIVGTKLASALGIANLPDAGGMFLRGQEFASSPNNDPERDSNTPVGSPQGDDVKPHSHSMNPAGAHSHAYEYFVASGPTNLTQNADWTNVRYGVGWEWRNTSSAGDHAHSINNNSGSEARPRNLNLWVYVRIN